MLHISIKYSVVCLFFSLSSSNFKLLSELSKSADTEDFSPTGRSAYSGIYSYSAQAESRARRTTGQLKSSS